MMTGRTKLSTIVPALKRSFIPKSCPRKTPRLAQGAKPGHSGRDTETTRRAGTTLEHGRGGRKRKDSQLAREFIASLPRGLNREQQIELVRGWCDSAFTSKGLVVDLAVHKSKNGLNPHAHILCPLRPISEAGFGKKPDTAGKFNGRGAAGLAAKTELDGWRASWEKHVNTALEKAGREERVDRRSLKARGIEQIPEPKIGVAATAMKRRGVEADPKRFQDVRAVKLLNEVLPMFRNIQKQARKMNQTGHALWLERSKNFLSSLQKSRMFQNFHDKWAGLIRSGKSHEPDISR
jgi:ATP-dependent exoDNAse (exonuclease V) alpha subunit